MFGLIDKIFPEGVTDWKEGNFGATALVDEVPETDFVFYSMEELSTSSGQLKTCIRMMQSVAAGFKSNSGK